MKKQSNLTGVFLFIIIAAVLGIVCYMKFFADAPPDTELSEAPEYSEKVPVLRWQDGNEADFHKELTELLLKKVNKVTVSGGKKLTWTDVCKYNFWVENFSVMESPGNGFISYEFTYKKDADFCWSMKNAVDREAESIISCIPEGADDWQKLLTIHDELIKRISYDKKTDSPHTFDIYGALVNHKAVCQGYTYAMSYIASMLGINTAEIYSEDHVWNQTLDSESAEQFIDITWDDMDEYDKDGNEYIVHNCFCIEKDQMEKLEDHKTEDKGSYEPTGKGIGDNYYRRMGYYISSGDLDGMMNSASEQYLKGSNIIELRFESSDDLDDAEYQISAMLGNIGYTGRYYVWKEPVLNCIAVGLNVPED